MFVPIAVAAFVGVLGWAYKALKPPPPKICGTPGGPPITSPRIKLSDGRHLAYKESGVPKEEAKYKIIMCHGLDSSKDFYLPTPKGLLEELQIYILTFDRAGYGESDPYPSRSVKSEAYDIQELADELQVGSKFYVMGFSMGAYPVYGCLKYIPHRLAGASLVVPFVHYWWPSLPANVANEGLKTRQKSDKLSLQIARHAPWLFYWWKTQKWFTTSSSEMAENSAIFCPQDVEIIKKLSDTQAIGQWSEKEKVRQQGIHESLYRDILVGCSKWEFDPLEMSNPFPNNEGSVHIWQGYEDRIIPYQINRYVAEKLPWIRYHEVPDGGHLMVFRNDICEEIFRSLLLG
ncbi:uncharacterized protein [Euphorbia lathyris]|uniref:uncharacterized protein n=1 Tax=Euphorbia lathyris TaxID=212925 RepID=UPI0033138CA9